MNEVQPTRSARSRFTLLQLLTLTALVALGIAVSLSLKTNRSLTQQRDELSVLSGRLIVSDEAELAYATMPRIAYDFTSWQVHIPTGPAYELRFGIGEVSQRAIPPIVGKVSMPAGQHRVTLYSGNSVEEEFTYVVYVDGQPMIEKKMGKEWLPHGWSSARGVGWPARPQLMRPPLQLVGQSFEPRYDFGNRYYFVSRNDDEVTCSGYRLWIDQADRTYTSASPFVGFPGDSPISGIGLRDGIRYGAPFTLTSNASDLQFTKPMLATGEHVLSVEAEFITAEGAVVSSRTFQSWQLGNTANTTNALNWQEEPPQTVHNAFLHAISSSSTNDLRPVVELQWDVNQFNSVGLRLADNPVNDPIRRWRLRFNSGRQHLWRQIQSNDQPWIEPTDPIFGETVSADPSKPIRRAFALNQIDNAGKELQVKWQTDVKLPLQLVATNDIAYAGLSVYQGLPVRLGIRLPSALKPSFAVEIIDQSPPGTTVPGGPIFDVIEVELDATPHEWIWLSADVKE